MLVAAADQDPYFDESACAVLDQALREAGVEGQVTIYRGALHGFAPPDCPTYDQAASERHWSELLALFAETLG